MQEDVMSQKGTFGKCQYDVYTMLNTRLSVEMTLRFTVLLKLSPTSFSVQYCECFLVSAYCSSNCKCVECKNRVGDKKREKIMAKRIAARATRKAASSSGRTTPDSVTIGKLCNSSLPPSSHTLPHGYGKWCPVSSGGIW